MSAPIFWSTPLKYCRWAARERPALFWSVIIGAAGPIAMPIVPPIRKYFGDVDPDTYSRYISRYDWLRSSKYKNGAIGT
ncbi:n19m, NADH-ubiquinone oxidoreductase 9.5 kDa subunit [Metarhizium acridum]|nr:n19m, NADH-ubiquinone oxidoreductase 9.5 kDa subunit [Metarhizium acridum]